MKTLLEDNVTKPIDSAATWTIRHAYRSNAVKYRFSAPSARLLAMILGTGIDIVEVKRIRYLLASGPADFAEIVFCAAELAYARAGPRPHEHLAGRFAAKEAAMKAIGTGWDRGVQWQDFEVVNEASGQPILVMHGIASELAREMGVRLVWLSLTHTAQYAVAQVILEN